MSIEYEESEELKTLLKNGKDLKCSDCDKFITCFVFRDFGNVIAQNMGKSDPSKYPVNPFDIAKICGMYHEKGT